MFSIGNICITDVTTDVSTLVELRLVDKLAIIQFLDITAGSLYNETSNLEKASMSEVQRLTYIFPGPYGYLGLIS